MLRPAYLYLYFYRFGDNSGKILLLHERQVVDTYEKRLGFSDNSVITCSL